MTLAALQHLIRAASALAGDMECLSLNGLAHLSDAAAASLSRHEGNIELNGLFDFDENWEEFLACSEKAAFSLSCKNGKICGENPRDWVSRRNR